MRPEPTRAVATAGAVEAAADAAPRPPVAEVGAAYRGRHAVLQRQEGAVLRVHKADRVHAPGAVLEAGADVHDALAQALDGSGALRVLATAPLPLGQALETGHRATRRDAMAANLPSPCSAMPGVPPQTASGHPRWHTRRREFIDIRQHTRNTVTPAVSAC